MQAIKDEQHLLISTALITTHWCPLFMLEAPTPRCTLLPADFPAMFHVSALQAFIFWHDQGSTSLFLECHADHMCRSPVLSSPLIHIWLPTPDCTSDSLMQCMAIQSQVVDYWR